MRREVRLTGIDGLWLGAILLVAIWALLVVYVSNLMVAPPRPRISDSARPILGIGLRETGEGRLFAERVTGPAMRAGLRAADRIVRIDDLADPGLEVFAGAVAAAPEGTTFTIEARREADDGTVSAILVQAVSELRPISPEDEGLSYESVAFPNSSGLTLRGWFVPAPSEDGQPSPAVVYGHGNGSDRRQWLRLASRAHEAGMAQLFIDFAGRGESDGDIITLGARESGDVRAAVDWLSRRPDVDGTRIVGVGKSMGAVALILATAEGTPLRALVLDGPFANLSEIVDLALRKRYLPAGFLRSPAFGLSGWRASFDPGELRPDESMKNVEIPVLLVHGEDDDLVPFHHARRLERAAGGPITLIPLPGAGHNSPRSPEVLDRMVRYLRASIDP